MVMKKSKVAVNSKAKKSNLNPKKKTVASLLKKPLKKLLVKMSAKAKKPLSKLPVKSAKASPKMEKKAEKKVDKKALKSKPLAVKPVKAKPAPIAKPEKELKPLKGSVKTTKEVEVKGSKKGAQKDQVSQVVAAVLTKAGSAKAAKALKGVKAVKVGAHSEKMCREASCENAATTKGYCRLDYIKNWKKIKRKEMILKEGKLNQYIEELVGKYPDKYIDIIRQDLSTEVNFNKVIHDLELDESIDDLDYDGDSIDALIGGIKKEVDDIGEDEF